MSSFKFLALYVVAISRKVSLLACGGVEKDRTQSVGMLQTRASTEAYKLSVIAI